MKDHQIKLAVLTAALAVLLAACGEEPRNAGAPPPAAAAPEAPAQPAAATPAAPATTAPASDLEAGLTIMQPRMVSSQAGFSNVEARPDHSLFMHPAVDKDSKAEFDLNGLASLELAPAIADLSNNPACSDFPAAGIVKLTWSLDDQAPNELTVDRNYHELIKVDVGNASRLKVAVNQANGTITCDWFTLGFVNVTAK